MFIVVHAETVKNPAKVGPIGLNISDIHCFYPLGTGTRVFAGDSSTSSYDVTESFDEVISLLKGGDKTV